MSPKIQHGGPKLPLYMSSLLIIQVYKKTDGMLWRLDCNLLTFVNCQVSNSANSFATDR